jgi:hypothetical protein
VAARTVGSKRLVAVVVATSNADGSEVSITIEEPKGPASDWKPTRYMERMSQHLENFPDGLSLSRWRDGLGGGRDLKEQAVSQLIADGYVRMTPKGNAHIHTVITPYRDPADTDTDTDSSEMLTLLADELGAVETDDLPDAY